MELFHVIVPSMIHLIFTLSLKISISVTGYDVQSHPNWKLLDKVKCGIPSVNPRIVGGNEADLGQYPWLALLGYDEIYGARIEYHCGGTLINSRYVLTAAHCMKAIYPLRLAIVKLGEHNTKNIIDCIIISCVGKNCTKLCADPVRSYYPEELIPHENFDNPEFQHDIGLIRLDRPVRITDWIKPICLPFGEILERNFDGRMAEVGGWGSNDSDGMKSSDVLRSLKMRVVGNTRCKQSTIYRDLTITDKHICAGEVENEDTCNGDSGVPLMMMDGRDVGVGRLRYFAIGVLSVGSTECGTQIPAIYTRVSEYMEWILNNIYD